MKKYNGSENEREYDFINNIVGKVTSDYPKVHTTWVGSTNGTIDVILNDVKIEFAYPVNYTEGFTRKPQMKVVIEGILRPQLKKICEKEFK